MANKKIFKVELLNGKQLAEKFRESSKRAQGKLEKSLLASGHLVEADVKKSFVASPSPPGGPPGVLTGTLKRSIATRLMPMNVQVGTNVIYARRLEFGFTGTDSRGRSYNQAARPYLYPALRRNKAEIIKIISKGLGEELASIFKGFTKIL